ncbi:MAG: xanthine dehydrogenase family protein molybdopterin-binding subunit [Gammaproteobacteria bacterium]|nr:xanthine dehydrogenase family protein molybdopterin-binding subunit [Gammaproteobacteria bacterium]
MEKYGIGQPVRRKEDIRFLTGTGCYLDDIKLENMAHGMVVRSHHAHARIKKIDIGAAAHAPGVLAVFTGMDWEAEGLGDMPTRTRAKNSDGSPVPVPPRPALVKDRVRFVGDAVAFIVAETMEAARDAAELVDIDYDPLPAVTDAKKALESGAPLVWDDIPSNLCVDFEAGDQAEVNAAFARAERIVSVDLVNNRVTATPIEPRGAIGQYDREQDKFTLVSNAQNVHSNRNQLAEKVFHLPPEKIRHVAYDVGGGFGVKNALYPEHALVLFAARRLKRPIKWLNDRSESFISDNHGRDQQSRVELALDADGHFLALRVDSVGNIGAYVASTGPFTPAGGTVRTQGGPYRIPAIYFRARVVFTHTAPTDPYRGAGRPEATYQIERAVDLAALELGMDPAELRRRNLIRRSELPYKTAVGLEIDSGDFERVFERTFELADWNGFPERAAAARARGRRRGIGVAMYLGLTGGVRQEYAGLTFEKDGGVMIAVGGESAGTGHETVLPQIVADRLGLPLERIRYRQADTDATPTSSGHGGSHGLELIGSAVRTAADKTADRAKLIASHLLEAAAADITLADGSFTIIGTNRSVSMADVIVASFEQASLPPGMEPGLDTAVTYSDDRLSCPNGCHVAEVEVDPQTGVVRLVDYTVVNDFGTIINPMITDGQVMGGSAQGIGQALLEEVVYDQDSGQLLTGSLMDYFLLGADNLPNFRIEYYEGAPTARNPLGVKGAGEAACGGAPPAIVSAVVSALSEYGVRHIDMPLTPFRIWQALAKARKP